MIGPAGTVHCSIAGWSRFIADHLRGARGERALLKADTYQALHTPRFGAVSAFGWGVSSRSVGGGTAFTHTGSNDMNASVALIAYHLVRLNVDGWVRAYLLVSWLFLVSTAFTLSKTVRDQHEGNLMESAARGEGNLIESAARPDIKPT